MIYIYKSFDVTTLFYRRRFVSCVNGDLHVAERRSPNVFRRGKDKQEKLEVEVDRVSLSLMEGTPTKSRRAAKGGMLGDTSAASATRKIVYETLS